MKAAFDADPAGTVLGWAAHDLAFLHELVDEAKRLGVGTNPVPTVDEAAMRERATPVLLAYVREWGYVMEPAECATRYVGRGVPCDHEPRHDYPVLEQLDVEQAHRQPPATAHPTLAPFYAVEGISNGDEVLVAGDGRFYGATIYWVLPGGQRREVAFVDASNEFEVNYEWAEEYVEMIEASGLADDDHLGRAQYIARCLNAAAEVNPELLTDDWEA